jgi:putative transposase
MARATFYYHFKALRQPDKHVSVRKRIIEIYHLHKGRYGYRRITLALRNEGFVINHKTVERLMSQNGLKSQVRIKRYRSYRGQVGSITPNVLMRNFKTNRPSHKWVTDVTEFSLFGQKRYLSPIMDLYNGEIISYTLMQHPTLLMVTNMLNKALKGLGRVDGLILHSDQGWHYQNPSYQNMLKNKRITQSMSRKGNCLDNAAMENFFGILKSELLYLQKFSSMDEFSAELKKYIKYYNNNRIKAKLKGMSPVNYRTHSSKT